MFEWVILLQFEWHEWHRIKWHNWKLKSNILALRARTPRTPRRTKARTHDRFVCVPVFEVICVCLLIWASLMEPSTYVYYTVLPSALIRMIIQCTVCWFEEYKWEMYQHDQHVKSFPYSGSPDSIISIILCTNLTIMFWNVPTQNAVLQKDCTFT